MPRSRLPIETPLCAAAAFILLVSGRAAAYDPPRFALEGPRHVIVLSTATMESCTAVETTIVSLGGRVAFVYRPSVLVAFMPRHAVPAVARRPEVLAVSGGPLSAASLGALTWEQRAGLAIWNDYYMGLRNVEGDGLPPGLAAHGGIGTCGIPVPPGERESVAEKRGYGQSAGSTSEYMLLDGPDSACRRYLAIFVFPESNGAMSTENWGANDPVNFMIAAVEGIEWWFARYTPARMALDVAGPPPVNIPHEPINNPHTFESTWINALLDALGVGPGTYFQRVRSWNNSWVGPFDTWTNTYFIVNSQNDPDGRFTDGWFDYSYFGGPFMVMTWDHYNWGNDDTDYMTAHETGHTFYALDEYYYPGCTGCCYDSWHSGYLDILNTNCEREGTSVECMMRNETRDEFTNGSVCVYTRNQMGWRDGDADGIPDILDHPPIVSLNGKPALVNGDPPTFTGAALPEVHTNLNPLHDPDTGSSTGDDISVNTIETVEYRLNGGAWLAATAVNGSFDEPSEDYQFTPAIEAGVRTIVDVRALNSRGLYSAIVSDTLTYIACPFWSDTFDDADVSDWSITNAGATIALDHTVAQGGFWSLKVTGAAGEGQGAVAYSPENAAAKHCNLDLGRPYTLEFWFRYSDFHWDQWVVFGHIRLLVDAPGLPLKYDPVGNWTGLTNLGNAFNTYIPANTWKQVVVQVTPSARTYSVSIGGVSLGSATYNAGLSPSTNLWFVENYSYSNYMNGWYDTFEITGTLSLVSVPARETAPASARILNCEPNPFRGATTIRYECPPASRVTLAVYDVTGEEVRRLVDAERAESGIHEAIWDGRDRAGRAAASGVYFARLTTGGRAAVRRILLLH